MDVPAAPDLEVIDGTPDGNVRSKPQAGAATDSLGFGSHWLAAGAGSLIWAGEPLCDGAAAGDDNRMQPANCN